MPPDKRSGPDITPGRSQDASPPSASSTATVAALLALSDERDLWLNRLLAAERTEYRRGFSDGRAAACIALAEMEEHYAEIAWWREWWAKVARIIQTSTDPGARRRRLEREIAADEQFLWIATLKRAEQPWKLTPLESAVLRRIRGADPGEAAQLDRGVTG